MPAFLSRTVDVLGAMVAAGPVNVGMWSMMLMGCSEPTIPNVKANSGICTDLQVRVHVYHLSDWQK